MNAIIKLAAVAIGALSIAGGAAVAQSSAHTDVNANPDTANYGTPPGADLKRDGSLSSNRTPAVPMQGAMTTDTSSTRTSTSNAAMSTPSPVPATTATDPSLQPRTDRN